MILTRGLGAGGGCVVAGLGAWVGGAAPVPEAIEYQHLPVTRPLMLRLGRALVHPERRQVAQRRSTLRLRP